MQIKTVWAVYFSATGTTEKTVTTIARTLAGRLGAAMQTLDFTLPAARDAQYRFGAEDLLVFGVPVYAGRVPNVLLPFLKSGIRGEGTPAIPVVLYGNRNYDDALMELQQLLFQNGCTAVAAGAFVGEHSFSATLGAGRPDDADLALARLLAEQAAQTMQSLPSIPQEPIPVAGEDPIRPYYTPRDRNGVGINILKVKPKVADSCTGCGLCAAICPMGSIVPENIREYRGICIKCGACIKRCPVHARYYDDAGYLYHQHELEEVYARRGSVALFLR